MDEGRGHSACTWNRNASSPLICGTSNSCMCLAICLVCSLLCYPCQARCTGALDAVLLTSSGVSQALLMVFHSFSGRDQELLQASQRVGGLNCKHKGFCRFYKAGLYFPSEAARPVPNIAPRRLRLPLLESDEWHCGNLSQLAPRYTEAIGLCPAGV